MGKADDGRIPRVIGAGFGRTGTASLKRALEQLGFGPCHHMEEVVKHPAEVPTWEAAARGEPVDWKAFLRGWGSCVDFPSSFYYRQIAAAFPDAKVILTVRDPGAWYDSFRDTIHAMIAPFPNRLIGPWLPFIGGPFRVGGDRLLNQMFEGHFEDRAASMQMFRDHIEQVKREFPAERLLVYEVKEGWEPLCRFLGVDVPDVPFPRVNDAKEFQRRTSVVTAVSWMLLFTPLGPLAALSAWRSRPQKAKNR
jgi:hypothetical protein